MAKRRKYTKPYSRNSQKTQTYRTSAWMALTSKRTKIARVPREGELPTQNAENVEAYVQNQCIGVSRGGRRTKIHVAVDGLGNPIRVFLTSGDSTVLGDKAYGSYDIREYIANRDADFCIPPKSNESDPHGMLIGLTIRNVHWWRISSSKSKSIGVLPCDLSGSFPRVCSHRLLSYLAKNELLISRLFIFRL